MAPQQATAALTRRVGSTPIVLPETGAGFFPDFVICVNGRKKLDGIALADTKERILGQDGEAKAAQSIGYMAARSFLLMTLSPTNSSGSNLTLHLVAIERLRGLRGTRSSHGLSAVGRCVQ